MEEKKSNEPSKVGTFLSSAANRVLNLLMILVIIALAALVAWFWHENELLQNDIKNLNEKVEGFEKMSSMDESRDIVVKEKMDEVEEEMSKENMNIDSESTVLNSQLESETTSVKIKTSKELLEELLLKDYSSAVENGFYSSNSEMISDYKIYKEVKSPYSNKTVVLYGTGGIEIKNRECNPKASAIFINNNGVLGEIYYVQGACNVSLGTDIKWKDANTVLFNEVITDEGGVRSTQKTLKVK